MKKERITEIATHHQRAMSSVHPHAIIGTIEDAIEQALTEAKIFLQPDVISSVCQHPLKYKVANDVRWFCPDGCGYLYGQTDL